MTNVEDHSQAAVGAAGAAIAALDTAGGLTPPDFDPARYRAAVDQFDITEDQKQELLATLWSIMRGFVELGFQADVCAAVFPAIEAIPDENKL